MAHAAAAGAILVIRAIFGVREDVRARLLATFTGPADGLQAFAALDTAGAKEAFGKQNFIIVPNKSLEDSAKWMASELERWQKISAKVKLDLQ